MRHSSYLLGSRLLSRLVYILFFIYAASHLGPELFGALAFALATVELLSAIGDLGLTRYGARELVRDWDNRSLIAGEVLVLQLLSSLVLSLAGLVLVIVWNPSYPKNQLLLLGLVAILVSGLVNTAETLFIAGRRFFFSALFTFVGRVIYVGIGLAALLADASVVMVMWAFVIGVMVESALRIVYTVVAITPFSMKIPWRKLKHMVREMIPFAVAAVANIAFLRVSVMILEFLDGDVAVGVFSVASTIFMPLIWIPLILNRTMFPGLTEDYEKSPQQARYSIWQWYRLMALLGIPVSLAICLLAPPALSYFPEGYSNSAGVLQILIWSLPLMLLMSISFNILQIINRERSAARAQVLGTLVGIAANFILIPSLGVYGAALATVIGAAVIEVQFYHDVHVNFLNGKHMISLLIHPVMGGVAMVAVALILFGLSPWLATAAGLLAYALTILVTGGVRLSEIRSLAAR